MFDKKKAKEEIKKLVDKYNSQKEQGKIRANDEEQIKQHFIEPLFEILGWDMRNPDEVIKEERIGRKKVDFSFKINDQTKFFIEAKAYNIDLLDKTVVEQALGYGWNGGITWTVLTNFEQLFILNCEWKTTYNLLMSKYKTLSLNQFATDKFEDLWLLSKESFLANRLNELAEKEERKAKKSLVTTELFNDLTEIRNHLRADILKQNPKLCDDSKILEEIIQRIIDKLIFIRKTEDLGIENFPLKKNLRLYQSGQLKELCKKVQEIFVEFDNKYNSEMFKPEHISNTVQISDESFFKVVKLLYSTDERFAYDFASIPADILGNIYEQYLSLLLKGGNIRGKYESSSTKKKEHGIYYTPTYIVDYIIKNTVGEWVKEKKNYITKIKILDPACGSGSFLIKALDYLAKERKKIDGKEHQNTINIFYDAQKATSLKSDIALNNIYGVDLDEKAVDITQLNLLLKIAENRQKLPKLRENIKIGNSLIDDITIAGDKAFEWEEEFKEIIGAGGFDVVIGNPPYVRPHNISLKDKSFLWKKYQTSSNKTDIYAYFFEKGISLLKNNGKFGFITSNTYFSLESFKKLRKLILDMCCIEVIVSKIPSDAFDATVSTSIIILKKEKNASVRQRNVIKYIEISEKNREFILIKKIPQLFFLNDKNYAFTVSWSEEYSKLIKKIIDKTELLGGLFEVRNGLATGDDPVFIKDRKESSIDKAVIYGEDIKRYRIEYKDRYVHYDPIKMIKHRTTARPASKGWFEIEEKIVIHQVGGAKIKACIDYNNYYATISTILIRKLNNNLNLKYLLGIINSKLIWYWYKKQSVTSTVKVSEIRRMPIKVLHLDQQQPLINLVDRMLSLNKRLHELKDKSTDEKAKIETEIEKTDQEIDEIVYKLYGITEEEKKIIKESLK